MDKLNELSHGAKVVLGAGIAFFVFSFFKWFKLENTSFGENMWHGVGFIAGLVLIALIVWQAIRLANIKIEVGVTPSMITAALAVLLLIFTVIRFIDKPGGGIADSVIDRTIWAWLGLVLAIVIVVGAWMNMQAAGESLGDVRDKMQSMTGSGAAAAPAAEAAAPAPVPAPEPAAASEPAPTPAPEAAPAEPAAEAAEEATEGDDEPRSA